MELNNRQTKILTFVLGAFSIISGFFSVFDLSSPLQIAVFGTTVFVGIIALILFRKVRGNELATEAFLKALDDMPKNNLFSARVVDKEFEVKEVARLDREAFPDTYFSFDLIRGMWQAYPKGLTGLFDSEGEMIGVFGLWPVKKAIFDKIIKGECTEQDITIEMIDKKGRRYWYAGGLIITRRYQVTQAIKVLLSESMANWYDEVRDLPKVSMFSGAYSKEGEAILKRFGLVNIHNEKSEKLSHSPIYAAMDIPPTEMHRFFARIFSSVSQRWTERASLPQPAQAGG